MIQRITFNDFLEAFRAYGRADQFGGYDGLKALFDAIEALEDDIGEDIQLDVIGLCCDYAYFQDLEDFRAQYGEQYETIEDIEAETTVIPVDDDAFIILQF